MWVFPCIFKLFQYAAIKGSSFKIQILWLVLALRRILFTDYISFDWDLSLVSEPGYTDGN